MPPIHLLVLPAPTLLVLYQRHRHTCLLLWFQGILFNTNESLKTTTDLTRVWIHEAARVYRDKLVDEADIVTYNKVLKDAVKKSFEVGLFVFCLFVFFFCFLFQSFFVVNARNMAQCI